VSRLESRFDGDFRRQMAQLHAILLAAGDSARAERIRPFASAAPARGPGA
jgi:hypothetical protein